MKNAISIPFALVLLALLTGPNALTAETKGQASTLPAVGTPAVPPPPPKLGPLPEKFHFPSLERVHRVLPGETLIKIARLHGVSVSNIAKLNHLRDPNRITTGQELRLPPAAKARPAASQALR